MNIEEWDNVVGIGTFFWFIWFIIELLTIDYNVFCFWVLEESALCLKEPVFHIDDSIKEWSEKISILILGFFVFDLGFRAGKIGWKKCLHDRGYIFDIAITIPFFWIFEPWAFMRTLRVLKVIRVGLNVYKAYQKQKRLRRH